MYISYVMFDSFSPPYFEWWHIPFLFLAGLIGESYGALVGGGSLVTLPALLFLGVPVHSAVAINTAGGLGTEAGILSETYRKVRANKKPVLLMAIPITAGGVLGTYVFLNTSADLIKYLMVIAVLLVLGHTLFSSRRPPPIRISRNRYALLGLFLFLTGVYTNFMAVGVGTFGKMALMSLVGYSFIQSQGLQSTASIPARLLSLVITSAAGLIIWPYLLTKWVANFLAGKYATKIVKIIPDSHMRVAIATLSAVFIIYLLFS